MSVQILIDSTTDLFWEEAEQLGIRVVPLTVHFGDHQYIDKLTITDEEFYGMLDTEAEMPTTTQVSPQSFLGAHVEYPNDETAGIYISQELNGTYQPVVIAKEEYGRNDVYPIDSTTASADATLLVREVICLCDEGESGKEIAEYIIELAKYVEMLAVFNTMEYLVKGGRLSSAKEMIGNLLGIKPIIRVKDDVLEVIEEERGMKKVCDFVTRHLRRLPDFDSSMLIAYSHSFNQQNSDALKQELGEGQILLMGSVVGTHAGPGAISVGYFRR